jgi:hypothetical protein
MTTAAHVTAERNIHFEDPVSKKISDLSLTNPTTTIMLQMLNPSLLKAVLRYVNGSVTAVKHGRPTTVNE